ncbi:MAG: hypothetical protein ACFB02_08185 [Mastigocoleus sp.]
MSNRLQIFRERMAAFEGAANPQEAIESGYYVKPPGNLLAERISARVALRPASSHLLIGGIGSGKTTQLLVACENLKKIGDIYPIYVDVSLYSDISEITPGVLTAIAGVELSKLLKEDSDNEEIEILVETIFNIAYGYSKEVSLDIHFFDQNYKGIIPAKNNYGIGENLIETVSSLGEYIVDKFGNKIVLLFDGLDRLTDSKTLLKILASDAKVIENTNIGLVIVGALASLYGDDKITIENSLDYFYHQPCFDIQNDSKAYNFFAQVLKSRLQENFIKETLIDPLIKFSGGILRDLITLTQSAIEETYISGDEKLEQKHIKKAVLGFAKSQVLGLSDDDLKYLRVIINTEKFIPRTDQHIKLLVNRRIIEYEYPKQRYVVHPAIVSVLNNLS